MEYIAYLCKDTNAQYAATFPDLPGCTAGGRTLNEARNLAGDALTQHLAQMVELGAAVPKPSTLDELAGESGMLGAVAVLVSAEVPEKTVRVNITARASQLEAIDRLARLAGMTRSAFLVQAAIRESGTVGRRGTVVD